MRYLEKKRSDLNWEAAFDIDADRIPAIENHYRLMMNSLSYMKLKHTYGEFDERQREKSNVVPFKRAGSNTPQLGVDDVHRVIGIITLHHRIARISAGKMRAPAYWVRFQSTNWMDEYRNRDVPVMPFFHYDEITRGGLERDKPILDALMKDGLIMELNRTMDGEMVLMPGFVCHDNFRHTMSEAQRIRETKRLKRR